MKSMLMVKIIIASNGQLSYNQIQTALEVPLPFSKDQILKRIVQLLLSALDQKVSKLKTLQIKGSKYKPKDQKRTTSSNFSKF